MPKTKEKRPLSARDRVAMVVMGAIVLAVMVGFVAIPFMVGWIAVNNIEKWWDEHNFFEFVALCALVIGMVQFAVSLFLAGVGLALCKGLSVSQKAEDRLFDIGERVGTALMLSYGVPGLICGWIALSWWLLTGDYLVAERNHPGILESMIGAIGWLIGRALGIAGFLALGWFVYVPLGAARKKDQVTGKPGESGRS